MELGLDIVHGLGYHAAKKTHLPLDSGVYVARTGYVFESLGCEFGSLITQAGRIRRDSQLQAKLHAHKGSSQQKASSFAKVLW